MKKKYKQVIESKENGGIKIIVLANTTKKVKEAILKLMIYMESHSFVISKNSFVTTIKNFK